MKPFIKWAGGKTQLWDRIWERTPNKFETYYEPFLGGGAVLFNLRPEKAVINDINPYLINTYKQLQKDSRRIIREVNKLDRPPCNQEYYLDIRKHYNEKIEKQELDEEMAALLIWINKHCFNGLYRVNKKGLFNVPFNGKETGKSIDEKNIMDIGYYLQNNDIKILCVDFEEACKGITEKDFVYFDSPYVPVSKTAAFTDYTKDGFTYDDHLRLAALYKSLADRGVRVMLSNHDVDLVHELYGDFTLEGTEVRRFINSDATKRKGKEVIITNYEYHERILQG